MTVAELLADITSHIPEPVGARQVDSITYDSRKVAPGSLFFAFAGAKLDGRAFATDALAKGAIAAVSELSAPEGFAGTWIQVRHGREALALAAGKFFGHPDRRLHLVGITGTNGKTTTSYIVDSIFRRAGFTTALIGTVEYRLAGRPLPAVNTTPESVDLFRLFLDLERAGGSHVTMETSSHALALGRVHGIRFETVVFTNLSRDHLDFHSSMEDYFRAKRKLFVPSAAPPPRYAVINHDDEYGKALAQELKTQQLRTQALLYGLEEGAGARAHRIATSFDGVRFEIQYQGQHYPVDSALVGKINVYNILAAWCTARANGVEPDVIAAGIRECTAVPGRFERVQEGQPFLVVVDYAHTDDALRNTIGIARDLTGKRVITLFGCGGDRDRAKRPLMGMAAAEASDLVVLTSDNPRSEDPVTIMNDALVGIRRFDTPHIIEPDRERGIRRALEEAGPGDVVILAGKGHETYQVLGDKTIAFDDREVARRVLKGFGYEGSKRVAG